MLRKEHDIKNHQIENQSKQLSQQTELMRDLSDRLREGNVLIASLQQQLSLPGGDTSGRGTVVDATTQPRAGESPPKKKSPIKPTKKRGLFDRLLRRK
jgi:hypothetical protein